jgi:hypothetical protein
MATFIPSKANEVILETVSHTPPAMISGAHATAKSDSIVMGFFQAAGDTSPGYVCGNSRCRRRPEPCRCRTQIGMITIQTRQPKAPVRAPDTRSQGTMTLNSQEI